MAKVKMTREERSTPEGERDYQLRYNYGISLEQYNEMASQQRGVCAICKRAPDLTRRQKRLYVDHDHVTGRVRGLLCHKCNTSLGGFGDSPYLLAEALAYLEKHHA